MKNLFITFSFLFVAFIVLTFFIGVNKTNKIPILKISHPHFYNNEQIPIDKISLTVFYFVPKDSVIKKENNWKEITEQHLKKLIDFHSTQFNNSSKITYEFFPEIITGEKTTKEYESFFEYDDQEAIIPVKEEITRRIINPDGPLHSLLKNNNDTNSRKVYLVIFEGNGAAGNDDFSLISRSYLTDSLYKEEGTTFLAHEFYHTLGIPDYYQKSTYVYKDNQQVPISLITKKDIMGQVNVPIYHTYIDIDTLKKMGL